MSGWEIVGRIVTGLAFFFIAWVGSAQLGVLVFGHENNIIILIAVMGMFLGISGAMRIVFPGMFKDERR